MTNSELMKYAIQELEQMEYDNVWPGYFEDGEATEDEIWSEIKRLYGSLAAFKLILR